MSRFSALFSTFLKHIVADTHEDHTRTISIAELPQTYTLPKTLCALDRKEQELSQQRTNPPDGMMEINVENKMHD